MPRLVDKLDQVGERPAYAGLVQEYLREVWAEVSGALPGASLGLVGSFARGAGGPRSDLDVVVLLPKPLAKYPGGEEAVSAFVQTLWDSGLGVDHSVRTPAEASDIAKTDLPALTGLLNLTHVAGDAELTAGTAKRILHEYHRASRRRVEELLEDADARWNQFDKLDRLNEPDLKNSEGGLRDVDLLQALSTAWMTDYDRPAVSAAEEVILDARDSLHAVTGRHFTRLLRIYQEEVAERLGYQDETELMRSLRAASETIAAEARRAAGAARSAQKSWGPMGLSSRKARRRFNPDWVTESLQVTDGRLFFRDHKEATDPMAILELATWSAKNKIPIASATLKDISAATQQSFVWTPGLLAQFVELLGAGEGLRQTWSQLDRAGIPVWVLPEWEALRGRPQSADFHQWTVDRHLIETVIRMQAIINGEEPEWDGQAIPRPDLALLTALLHDVGKQPPDGGVNHPAHGAKLAEPILKKMGVGQADSQLCLTLINHHLLLATLSTEEDPEAPETAQKLLNAVGGDQDALTMLEALTFADSLGAGPKAWSPWRAALIRQLISTVHS